VSEYDKLSLRRQYISCGECRLERMPEEESQAIFTKVIYVLMPNR